MNKYIGRYCFFMYSKLSLPEQIFYRQRVFAFIRKVSKEYPRFQEWFDNLFAFDGRLRSDREIIICEKLGKIAGIAILKKTAEEQKICTLRVAKEHQFHGIGKALMELSFEWLENEKPLITLHKSKMRQFHSLFDYYGFALEQKKTNYYNIFCTEFVYNGVLPDKKIIISKFELLDLDHFWRQFLASGHNNLADFFDAWLEQLCRKEALEEYGAAW